MNEIRWRKSSRCHDTVCVEVADLIDGKAVRDSKLGARSPVLTFTAGEWRTFVAAVKRGEFDA